MRSLSFSTSTEYAVLNRLRSSQSFDKILVTETLVKRDKADALFFPEFIESSL